MGYILVMGFCQHCRGTFGFNPVKVPSIIVDGDRKPVCKLCVEWANPIRVKRGLAPIEILPGAYDECDESELQ